ncbi:LacI family DNA-binding transcriptional regulator [Microbacterium paludicola]|uniref:LacI family DNA-binding transcriptional regulator n=1 Tax=Microbacterium paludicola TaxID=300019 RepID=UPI0009030F5E|nr:LacI family DNA-binding transcriptional regulator [Microbacterium paludicola]APF34147.1 LacI family transcriptional regulator [Microbacterium paludicola]
MAGAKQTTITDVAAHAGVSLATVSRVMNGNATVDPALAERVRASAAQLGYSANPLARSLVLGRTQTISVVVPDLANPTFQGMLRGLSRAAVADGYHVLIADSDEHVDEERLLALESRRRSDGLILCAPRMSDEQLAEVVADVAPVVLVNRTGDAPSVAADYRTPLRGIIDHLYTQGHRRFAYLAGAARSASSGQRLSALDDARRELPDCSIAEIPAGVDFASGAGALDDVLTSGATAVLAFNDLSAMGLLSAATERGIPVPGRLSIAGFDDIPFARYTSPALTTAAVPMGELGARAWSALHDLLDGRTPEPAVTVSPEVIVRGSTGAPAA